MNKPDEELKLIDLGDATVETKQVSPWPPLHADSAWTFGSEPDEDDKD